MLPTDGGSRITFHPRSGVVPALPRRHRVTLIVADFADSDRVLPGMGRKRSIFVRDNGAGFDPQRAVARRKEA